MVAIYLVLPLPEGSCGLPGDTVGRRSPRKEISLYLALLRVGFSSIPIRTGTWCALTAPFHPCLCPALSRTIGDLVSVALSVASRRLGVTQHPAQRSPDFPLWPESRSGHPALLTRPVYALPERHLALPAFHRHARHHRAQKVAPLFSRSLLPFTQELLHALLVQQRN